MNLNEFKAWLDGFSESIDGAPTADQWAKIKGKLETVTLITPTVQHPKYVYGGGMTSGNIALLGQGQIGMGQACVQQGKGA